MVSVHSTRFVRRSCPRGIARRSKRTHVLLSACFAALLALEAASAAVTFLSAAVRPDLRSSPRVRIGASPNMGTDELLSLGEAKAGDGKPGERELTQEEEIQVTVYRGAVFLTGFLWLGVCAADLLISQGLDSKDTNFAATALKLADFTAGIAALAVPTGSLVIPGLFAKALGAIALASTVLPLGLLGSVAGPLCVAAVSAREMYWSGLVSMPQNVIAVPAFLAVAFLRFSQGDAPPPLEAAVIPTGDDFLDALPTAVVPVTVGPPVPLNVLAAGSFFITSNQKQVESRKIEFEEEGDAYSKPSNNFTIDDGRPTKQVDEMFTEFETMAEMEAASASRADNAKGSGTA